jgi:hypothetical protein
VHSSKWVESDETYDCGRAAERAARRVSRHAPSAHERQAVAEEAAHAIAAGLDAYPSPDGALRKMGIEEADEAGTFGASETAALTEARLARLAQNGAAGAYGDVLAVTDVPAAADAQSGLTAAPRRISSSSVRRLSSTSWPSSIASTPEG